MNEKKLDNLFKKIKAPDFILSNEKAQLRRNLLNSKYFKQNSAPQINPVFRLKYILGAVAGLTLIVLLTVINLIPERISARELIKDIGAVYDRTTTSGRVHHLRFILNVLHQRPFEEEKWVYEEGEKIRALQRDVKTGEILGHSIFHGDQVYAMENSKFKVKYKIKKPSTPPDVPSSEKDNGDITRSNFNIIITPVKNKRTSDGQRIMQAYIMTSAFDYNAFQRQSPIDVVNDLMKKPDVDYLGSEFNESLGKNLDVLEKRWQATSFSLKLEFSEKHLPQVGWLCEQLRADEFSLFMESPIAKFLQQRNISSDIDTKSVEVIENIKIFTDTKKIYQVDLSIRDSGKETYRAEKTFLTDEYVDYSQAIFDPEKYNLALRLNKKEGKPNTKSK